MPDISLKRFQLGLEDAYTSGAGSVYNGGSPVAAVRRMAVDKSVSADWQPTFESPVEARGSYAGAYTHILHMVQASGKLPAAIYPDDLVYLFRMLVSGVPTVTALKPTVATILSSTALSAASNSQTLSATTQPNALADIPAGVTNVGKILEIVLSNAAANTQQISVAIAGTDIYGNSLNETVVFTAGTTTPSKVGGGAGALSCTLYTQNYFKTITAGGITVSSATNLPSSDNIVINAVNAFQWKFVPDMATSTVLSATAEYWDGSASWQLPGVVMSKADLQATIGKSLSFSGSFDAQKKIQLPAGTGSINPAAAAGDFNALTNLQDNFIQAIPTYQTLFLAGDMGSDPDTGLTQVSARLSDFKFSIDNATKLSKTADGTPYPTFVSRDYYGDKISATATLMFNSYSGVTADPSEVAKFLTYTSRTVRVAFPGPALPCGMLSVAGNWPTQLQQSGKGGGYGFQVTVAGKWTQANETAIDTRAAFSFNLAPEVDLVKMGVPYQATVISRINPNL